MKKLAILSAASALALAGTVAYAQPTPPPQGGPGGPAPRQQMNRADFDSLTDARIAGIQAGLKLNADQQRLWTPVEQALRAQSAARADRFEEGRQRREQARQQGTRPERPDLMQRLEQRAAASTKYAENLNALSNAMKPFWGSLDDRQKRLLPVLMREGRTKHAGWRQHGPHQRMGMMRHGHQQPGGQPPAPPAQPQ